MRENPAKCEEWENGFVLLVVSLAALWLVAGVWFTGLSGVIPTVGFVALSVGCVFFAFYATCRYCYYYGKKCYLALGLIVPFFSQRVDKPAPTSYFMAWVASFLVVLLFPLVFIFRDNSLSESLLYSIVYLAAPITGIAVVSRYACSRCKNTGCMSNPDRKKQYQDF